MKRLSRVVFALALLALCASAYAASSFPEVSWGGFDEATFTYTYRVTCPADSTFPFGRLTILAEVPQGGIYFPWGQSQSVTNWSFYTQDREWDDDWNVITSNGVWEAVEQGQIIPAATYWVGEFSLIVPHSRPVMGRAFTQDGGPLSLNGNYTDVPGPALLPEPSSLLALGGGLLGGLIPLIRRRR